jgi:class 3 adenylate cyclase/tetratricopeptide (TPR) repeat protein
MSESLDAEDVRELLSRYFDICRRLIELYGGTVEKFIGDAVMAVWGTPVAQEDDAERAVRAALDLVVAVSALGDEVGAPELAARAGVLTGEAAVTIGAEGQGMVAGDLVNTASRIQSVADAGAVLVGEVTKRSSEAAIAYEDGRTHELKGKSEPLRVWRALRVTGSRGGALKAEGLEPPFVGRDRELRLIKEVFHASAEEEKAHLVSVIGIAGIGKSRLAWEFFKYVDGLADEVWWHQGRCLAYGEGVAYWALAEMVRMRARITEEEPVESALVKLRASLAEHVPDIDERAWLEPRLAHLLGLAERQATDREDLFSAWRLFFERLAERNPTVLVFEDLQWADAALLDFVEHLLDWSRSHSLFVLALARPELAERRSGWGAVSRNSTTLALEALSASAMEALIDGFVPGLPTDVRAQVLERAEGVPLYAVETVRMLLDRNLLERDGEVYRLTGPIETLEVPETLHALIAARLDGLGAEERRILQDASVLGKSFTKAGLSALSGLGESELDLALASLNRKEILSVQADPRSPERGQYTFLQDLLKRVAYETLAKKDRKARHLAAAAHLEQAWGSTEQEVAGVVAAHYLDAYSAAPEADDASEIKAQARERLAQAAERAASLAATEEARRYFEQAATLADEPLRRAELLERAAITATALGPFDMAVELFERTLELYQAERETHAAARVSAWLGWALWMAGDLESGSQRLEQAFEVLADEQPDADIAQLAEARARLRYFLGDVEGTATRIERALEIAEALYVPSVLVDALNTKHLVLHDAGREEEALALLQHAIELGRRHDLGLPLNRALYNLGYQMTTRDDFAGALRADREALDLAHKRGNRVEEAMATGHLIASMVWLGEWDEAEALLSGIDPEIAGRAALDLISHGVPLFVNRGDVERARTILDEHAALAGSDELQASVGYALSLSLVLRAEGKPAEALATIRGILAQEPRLPVRHPFSKLSLVAGVEAALEADDLDAAEAILGEWEPLRPVDRTPFLDAHHARLGARLAARRGTPDPEGSESTRAAAIFRALGMPFHLGVTLLEHGEQLTEQGRRDEAEPLIGQAREIFERLRAAPWLERAAHASPTAREPEPVTGRS